MRNFQIPTSESQKTVAPGQVGQFGQSGFQNVGGVLSVLGGASGAGGINSGAKEVWNAIKGLCTPGSITEQEFTQLWNPADLRSGVDDNVTFDGS
jgi:hypothetical protein